MRILLDENFQQILRHCWEEVSIPQMFIVLAGLASRTASFFVARKANVKYPFGIVVVRCRSNRIVDLTPYISNILSAASQVGPGRVITVGT
jgi:hypothetical protein